MIYIIYLIVIITSSSHHHRRFLFCVHGCRIPPAVIRARLLVTKVDDCYLLLSLSLVSLVSLVLVLVLVLSHRSFMGAERLARSRADVFLFCCCCSCSCSCFVVVVACCCCLLLLLLLLLLLFFVLSSYNACAPQSFARDKRCRTRMLSLSFYACVIKETID